VSGGKVSYHRLEMWGGRPIQNTFGLQIRNDDIIRRIFGSVRLRYLGPRPLIEDNSVQSKPTSLLNAEIGDRLSRSLRIALDLFNVTNAKSGEIDDFDTSGLPGEPLGAVADVHSHPALPRTARVTFVLGF
jgi:hypothetical protein